MKVRITIDHALKKYDGNTVIPDLSLVVEEGELFTLLGPSGCGKTTLLRMIAGFNSVEGGKFLFNDKEINNMYVRNNNRYSSGSNKSEGEGGCLYYIILGIIILVVLGLIF